MIIAVDTGNRCIKTAHAEPFSAGLNRHYEAKPFVSTDTLFYKGMYYTFSETQGGRREDKSVDDYYFILTLAAIAREIVAKKAIIAGKKNGREMRFQEAMLEAKRSGKSYREDIYLSVGLPPRDMVASRSSQADGDSMVSRYKAYFLRDGKRLEFVYNGIEFEVCIQDIFVSAQGFAAIYPAEMYSRVVQSPQAYIIDIGGYTTDIALVANRKIDLTFFESLDFGVIFLYNEVIDAVRRAHRMEINGVLIEAVLRGESLGHPGAEETVKKVVAQYAKRLVDALRDRKVDLELSLPVLLGGGAQLMRTPLLEYIPRKDVLLIPDTRANAIGYEVFAARMLREQSK